MPFPFFDFIPCEQRVVSEKAEGIDSREADFYTAAVRCGLYQFEKLQFVAVCAFWLTFGQAGLAENLTLDLGGGVKMEFVWIPLPGGEGKASVQIGDFTGVHGLEPVREVTLTGPFTKDGKEFGYYLGKTEVTEEQWATVMNAGKKTKFPATDKSYAEILAFVDALHSKGGQSLPKTPDGKSGEVRLPTEAEWEYAARGGTSAVNYQANDPYQSEIERFEVLATAGSNGRAREVATLPTNSLGLCDMLGNVREFVEGRYLEESGGGRLLKGGCYMSEKSEIRSSARTEQSGRAPFAGFRLCISSDAFTSLGQAQKEKEKLQAEHEKTAKANKTEAAKLEERLKQAEAEAAKIREESDRLTQEAAMSAKHKSLELAEKQANEEKARLEALKQQLANNGTPPPSGAAERKSLEQVSLPNNSRESKILVQAALSDFDAKNYDAALTKLQAVNAKTPDDAFVQNLLGAAYTKKKDYVAAQICFDKALQKQPDFFPAKFNVGELLFLQRRYAEALRYFQQMQERDPQNELLQFKVFLCQLQLGDNEQAAKALKTIKYPGDTPAWYYGQAAWASKHGDNKNASEYITRAQSIFGQKTALFDETFKDLGIKLR